MSAARQSACAELHGRMRRSETDLIARSVRLSRTATRSLARSPKSATCPIPRFSRSTGRNRFPMSRIPTGHGARRRGPLLGLALLGASESVVAEQQKVIAPYMTGGRQQRVLLQWPIRSGRRSRRSLVGVLYISCLALLLGLNGCVSLAVDRRVRDLNEDTDELSYRANPTSGTLDLRARNGRGELGIRIETGDDRWIADAARLGPSDPSWAAFVADVSSSAGTGDTLLTGWVIHSRGLGGLTADVSEDRSADGAMVRRTIRQTDSGTLVERVNSPKLVGDRSTVFTFSECDPTQIITGMDVQGTLHCLVKSHGWRRGPLLSLSATRPSLLRAALVATLRGLAFLADVVALPIELITLPIFYDPNGLP